MSHVWLGTGGQGIGVLAEFVQTICQHSEIPTYATMCYSKYPTENPLIPKQNDQNFDNTF